MTPAVIKSMHILKVVGVFCRRHTLKKLHAHFKKVKVKMKNEQVKKS